MFKHIYKGRIVGRSLQSRRYTSPPSHFGDPNKIPQTYDQNPANLIPQVPQTPPNQPQPGSHANYDRNSSIKELSSLLAMCALAYIAVDNYTNRIKVEKLNNEATAINLKTLQIQQQNFLAARQKRDIQILQERKEHARRTFKMGLHIALLRKQLTEAGLAPLDIEIAVNEFEKNVKADNSIKNVNGQALWLEDTSRMYFLSVLWTLLTFSFENIFT